MSDDDITLIVAYLACCRQSKIRRVAHGAREFAPGHGATKPVLRALLQQGHQAVGGDRAGTDAYNAQASIGGGGARRPRRRSNAAAK